MPPPDIIVAEDDTRNLNLPSKIKIKPSPLPLSLVYGLWEEQLKKKYFPIDRKHIIYFGDDIIKDG